MALNAFWGNKKVVIVNVGDNQLAKKIVSALKSADFKNVVELSAPSTYANYYGIYTENPDYTLFVENSKYCKVQLTKVEGFLGDRLGHFVSRDYTESKKAQSCYKHHLKMLGFDPDFLGAVSILFEEVKDMDWYYTDKSPMLHLEVSDTEGVDKAVVESIKDYFKR